MRVAATPFIDWGNALLTGFLEDYGRDVVSMRGLWITDGRKIAQQSSAIILDLVKRTDRSEAEGILLGRTNLPAAYLIDTLESTHRKAGGHGQPSYPPVSTAQAGHEQPAPGFRRVPQRRSGRLTPLLVIPGVPILPLGEKSCRRTN